MSTFSLHRSGRLLGALALLLCVGASGAHATAANYNIQATAQPKRLTYGDDNRVTLSVHVLDGKTGGPAADGTSVFLYTTLGTLSATTCYTQHGEISALLDNTTGPGKAYVTVTVGDTQETLLVEYLGAGGTASGTPVAQTRPNYRLDAGQVYFSADKRIFDLRDTAKFTALAFTITAGAIQYDVANNIITAQSDVVVNAGSSTISGEKMRLDLVTGRGAIVVVNPSIAYLSLTLPALNAHEDDDAKSTDFTPLNPLPTHTWIVCHPATMAPSAPTPPPPYPGFATYKVDKQVSGALPAGMRPPKLWKMPDYQVIVYPNDMVLFHQPSFYLNEFDHPLFSLPYHVLDLRTPQGGTFFNSDISLASDAGLNIDFPFYYIATGNRTGALHFRRVTPGSQYFRGESGFQLDMEEEYLVGNKTGDGGVYFDDLTNPTRSISWDHNQTFGSNTHLSMNASYSRYTADTPYTARGGFDYSRSFGPINTNLRATVSQFQEHQNGVYELYVTPPAVPLLRNKITLSFSPYIGFEHDSDVNATTNEKTATNSFYQGLGTSLGLPSFSKWGCGITENVSNELSRDGAGTVTDYIDLGASLRRDLIDSFTTSLTYGYSITRTFIAAPGIMPASTQPSQHLSVDLTGGRAQRWSFYAYSSYTIESKSLYNSLTYTYYPPFDRAKDGTPRLFIRFTAHQTTGDVSTTDQLISVGRNIGLYTVVCHFSPTGNTGVSGIGSATGQSFAVELQRQGF